jgi:hypothetical protein
MPAQSHKAYAIELPLWPSTTQSSLKQFTNLFDGVIHLHIEQALPKCRCRPARVSDNAVLNPLGVRIGCFTLPGYGVTKRVGQLLFAHPVMEKIEPPAAHTRQEWEPESGG